MVTGVAGVSDIRKLGRVGLKTMIYFEVVSTFALGLGYLAAKVFRPGAGLRMTSLTVDAESISAIAAHGHQKTVVDFLMNINPDTFAGAFTGGDILQVLLIAILTGIALLAIHNRQGMLGALKDVNDVAYAIIGLLMEWHR